MKQALFRKVTQQAERLRGAWNNLSLRSFDRLDFTQRQWVAIASNHPACRGLPGLEGFPSLHSLLPLSVARIRQSAKNTLRSGNEKQIEAQRMKLGDDFADIKRVLLGRKDQEHRNSKRLYHDGRFRYPDLQIKTYDRPRTGILHCDPQDQLIIRVDALPFEAIPNAVLASAEPEVLEVIKDIRMTGNDAPQQQLRDLGILQKQEIDILFLIAGGYQTTDGGWGTVDEQGVCRAATYHCSSPLPLDPQTLKPIPTFSIFARG